MGRGWQVWMVLTVIWTIIAVMSGWMNLPQARQMPHDPQFLGKLSRTASSILLGTTANAKLGHSALIWSEKPRIVRMSNGTPLIFPATTTDEQAALVASEYRQLLNVEADELRGPYVLEMLAIWLAAVLLLLAGLAPVLIYRRAKLPLRKVISGSHWLPSVAGDLPASTPGEILAPSVAGAGVHSPIFLQ